MSTFRETDDEWWNRLLNEAKGWRQHLLSSPQAFHEALESVDVSDEQCLTPQQVEEILRSASCLAQPCWR